MYIHVCVVYCYVSVGMVCVCMCVTRTCVYMHVCVCTATYVSVGMVRVPLTHYNPCQPDTVFSLQGVQSHDRHLFLFDDILIISKPIKQK